ncbi:LLM class flavin-dependent oxidoreductase [Natrinema caseinilyticum]|uniref:LLM class flavin-dependent oxidoreductase n=1 Tax=Natrinema caseinilyticum TaxID=2961570 RepID=UPI0020C348CD|nr:LLM class flavin-dependent oxidoreductase [Natrinema caseinilyticum]
MRLGIGPLTTQIPEDDPRTPEEKLQESVALAKKAEEKGFDSVWVSQHHRSEDNYLSSPFILCSAIAEATSEITIGVGVALAPFYEPLQLAEDAATVDALSGGRLQLGLAIGYHDPEFEQFDVPKSERVPRLIDCVEVCRRAWSEGRFSYDGHTVSYDEAVVNPTPPQGDNLPIVLGGLSEPAIRRCAEMGDAYIGGLTSTFTEIEGIAEILEDEGADLDEYPMHLLRDGFIGDDKADAWERMQNGLLYTQNIYAKWFAESSDFEEMEEPDDPEEAFKAFSVYGGADDLVEEIQRYEGVINDESHFIMRLEYPTMDHETAVEAVGRFGDEVLPQLR